MSILNIIPSSSQLKVIQGIESELLKRRKHGNIGGIVAIGWAILQILIALLKEDYLKNIKDFFNALIQLKFDKALFPYKFSFYEITVILILAMAVAIYFIFRWTSILMKEAEEPFRYTFWLKPFEPIRDTPGNRYILRKEDQFHLLHHDLMERLKKRIKRFSLLDETQFSNSGQKKLTSHIHITGYYAIRQDKKNNWFIHIMPRLRIGPLNSPEALADPVIYPLKKLKKESINNTTSQENHEGVLEANQYHEIVERVYSKIANEIYKQIFSDIQKKKTLFPTNYLRAAALFHEAKDFERSNTLDAYDYAIKLYRYSKRIFSVINIKWISRLFTSLSWLWRLERKFLRMEARTRLGYSRCLIHRRIISTLSGRPKKALFEIQGELKQARYNLEKLYNRINRKKKIKQISENKIGFYGLQDIEKNNRKNTIMAFLTSPEDMLFRRKKELYNRIKESLFDAYAVSALGYAHLGAKSIAKKFLDNAMAVDPISSEKDPLWLLAAAEIVPDINQKILYLKQATDAAPNFEITQYRLAYYSEMRMRFQRNIKEDNVSNVINEYEKVLGINPSNIGALASQGYLLWLIGKLENSKEKFRQGYEIKAMVRQTFIGDLNYGMARIAAEQGHFKESFNYYTEAFSADPGVGAYSSWASESAVSSYYEYIVPEMLHRYARFKKIVKDQIDSNNNNNYENSPEDKNIQTHKNKEVSQKTLNSVYSFILNDYGNACLNYFHRFGCQEQLENAVYAFEESIAKNPENTIAYCNLDNAYKWHQEFKSDKIHDCIKEAEKLAPYWPVVLIESVKSRAKIEQSNIMGPIKFRVWSKKESINEAEDELANLNKEFEKVENGTELNQKIVQKKKEIKKLKGEFKRLEIERINVEKKLEERIQEKFNKIISMTKLAPLSQAKEIINILNTINKMLDSDVDWAHLDQNDVDILITLVEILSFNFKNIEILHATEKLSIYLLNYYPENFELSLSLYNIYSHLIEAEEDAQKGLTIIQDKKALKNLKKLISNRINYEQNKKNCFIQIKSITDRWLEEDTFRFVSFFRYVNLSSKGEIYKLFKVQDDYEERKDYYHNLLGQVYFCQYKLGVIYRFQDIITEYNMALKYNPKNAIYHYNLGKLYKYLALVDKKQEYGEQARVEFWNAYRLSNKHIRYKKEIINYFKALGKWPPSKIE